MGACLSRKQKVLINGKRHNTEQDTHETDNAIPAESKPGLANDTSAVASQEANPIHTTKLNNVLNGLECSVVCTNIGHGNSKHSTPDDRTMQAIDNNSGYQYQARSVHENNTQNTDSKITSTTIDNTTCPDFITANIVDNLTKLPNISVNAALHNASSHVSATCCPENVTTNQELDKDVSEEDENSNGKLSVFDKSVISTNAELDQGDSPDYITNASTNASVTNTKIYPRASRENDTKEVSTPSPVMNIEVPLSQIGIENEIKERMLCAKTIEEGPARTPLFIPVIPRTTLETPTTVRIDIIALTIWRTPSEDTVIAGGFRTTRMEKGEIPTMCVVNSDFHTTTHRFMTGNRIKTGSCISAETSILIVQYDRSNPESPKPKTPWSVYTCKLDVSSHTSGEIYPLSDLEVTNPTDIFRLGKNTCGILCADPIRIEAYKMKDILLEKTIKATSTIYLDLPSLSGSDHACVTLDGHICVNSFEGNIVYVYNQLGDRLHTLGKGREKDDVVVPGMLYGPRCVQYSEDDNLIIWGVHGDIQVFDGQDWHLLKDKAKREWDVWHGVVTKNRVWTLIHDELTMYKF